MWLLMGSELCQGETRKSDRGSSVAIPAAGEKNLVPKNLLCPGTWGFRNLTLCHKRSQLCQPNIEGENVSLGWY